MQVLIPDHDHGYYVAHVRKQKALNKLTLEEQQLLGLI